MSIHMHQTNRLCNDLHMYTYFDSLNGSVSIEAQCIIVNLFKSKDTLVVKVKNVGNQTGTADCRLYAIAFCTSILHKQNPCSVVYSQKEMRIHL